MIKTPVTNYGLDVLAPDGSRICETHKFALAEDIADALNAHADLTAERDAYKAKCEAYEAMFNSVGVVDIGIRRFIRNNARFGNNKWVEYFDGHTGDGFGSILEAFAALDTKQEVEDGSFTPHEVTIHGKDAFGHLPPTREVDNDKV